MPKTTTRYEWASMERLPGGHRLFIREDGDVAIADQSGATPETTDDGVLWLDIGGDRLPALESSTIPVTKDTDKSESWVPVTRADLMALTVRYWGQLRSGDSTYDITEADDA